ncbi:MAG: exo-alpha-sialidase [Burkholderiales bacterium]|nr:exo-alpha-sialidase [Burkholderiales bacterium]
MATLLLATRKGVFVVARAAAGQWAVVEHHFQGDAVTRVVADGRDGAWYVALRHGHYGVKLQKSLDRGARWTEIPAPAFPKKPDQGPWANDETPWTVDQVWALAPGAAHEPGVLWAGCMPAAVFRSADSGASWQLCERFWLDERRKAWMGGGNDHPGMHSVCVDPHDSRQVTVAISCGGVWRTRDAGASWALIGNGFDAPYLPPEVARDPNTQDVHCISICAAQPDVIWAQHHFGVYRSVDGGINFTRRSAPMPGDFGFVIVADPINALRAWVVPAVSDANRYAIDGAMCVCRTDDGGKSWQQLRSGLPQRHAYHLVYRHGLALAPTTRSERVLAMASTTGGVWISEDAGDHWQTLDAALPPVAAVGWAA